MTNLDVWMPSEALTDDWCLSACICTDLSQVQCIKSYQAQEHDELTLEKADVLQAITITSDGKNISSLLGTLDSSLPSRLHRTVVFSIHRVGGWDPIVRWREGLVPQNIRGGDHKPQRPFAKPPREHSHQVRLAEIWGRDSLRPLSTVPNSLLLYTYCI